MRRLADVVSGRDNNLNLIRVVAAAGVLLSHAYPITLGPGTMEPLKAVLGVSLGTLSVYLFFAVSGFLIARSYDRSASLADWFTSRCLRLFPALFVVLLLTVLLLGPAITTVSLGAYFSDPRTIAYVPQNLALVTQEYSLPGVFDSNPLPAVINGSFWTLFYEVACYAGVLVLGLLRALRNRRRMLLFLALYAVFHTAVLHSGVEIHFKLTKLAELSLPFMVGTALYVWRERVPLAHGPALGLAALAALLHDTVAFHYALIIALCYGTFFLAFIPGGRVRRYNAVGDYSYGIYIYAFPMQQLAMALFGTMTPWENAFVAGAATLSLAMLSWHLVERPALGSRQRIVEVIRRSRRFGAS